MGAIRPSSISSLTPINTTDLSTSHLSKLHPAALQLLRCMRLVRIVMASHSPIVLSSSSPIEYRYPSITPRANRKCSSITESSSSPLPLFSAIFSRNATASNSRSEAWPSQQPNTKFAPAATLLRTTRATRDEPSRNGMPTAGSSRGRIHDNVAKDDGSEFSRRSNLQDNTVYKNNRAIDTGGSVGQEHYMRIASEIQDGTSEGAAITIDSSGAKSARFHKPSFSLAHSEARRRSAILLQQPTKKMQKLRTKKSQDDTTNAKSSRKRPSNAEEPSGAMPAKKSKKRFTKSASLVLNSDDSETAQSNNVNDTDLGFRAKKSIQDNLDAHIAEIATHCIIAGGKTCRQAVKAPREPMNVPSSMHRGDLSYRKSAYFEAHPETAVRGCGTCATGKDPSTYDGCHEVADVSSTCLAHPHRIDPVPTTGAAGSTPVQLSTTPLPSSEGVDGLRPSLSAVLSGLAYSVSDQSITSPGRTGTGEALTKRRRIELAESLTVAPKSRNPPKLIPAGAPKKPRAGKKRPQTITALATKAYQLPIQSPAAQSAVSAYFSPKKSIGAEPSKSIDVDITTNTPKPQNTRKPRAKKTVVSESSKQASKPAKAKAKSKEAKEPDTLAELYTPQIARAQERNQGFLFGTSSQLAAEESPTVIREIQLALRESEAPANAVARNSLCKSCVKVPSAPHGTDISVGQADRDLWCSASRDEAGALLDINYGIAVQDSAALTSRDEAVVHEATVQSLEPPALGSVRTSTLATESIETFGPRIEATGPRESLLEHPGDCHTSHVALTAPDGSWTILSSDDSPKPSVEPLGAMHQSSELANTTARPIAASKLPPILFAASRYALQPLDINVNVLGQASSAKGNTSQSRALTTDASPTPQKPARGRPRKELAEPAHGAANPPNPRGKSPKQPKAGPASTGSGTAKRKARTLASQPSFHSDWINIDEISDSDSAAKIPSPPRRRARSPPTPQQLKVDAVQPPLSTTKAPAAASCNLKPESTSFPALREALFPQITNVVRSTVPSTDFAKPTWHEKILLYDPIVLEDLTAWLNEQGLRVESRKLKPKAKTKGRKKKDAPLEEPPEYETVREELKPWMVQKWCEEKSICCFWREGLNGARRSRY